MTVSTSPLRLPRSRMVPPLGAFVLTVAGNMLLVGILAAGAAGGAVAAFAIFGPAILEAF